MNIKDKMIKIGFFGRKKKVKAFYKLNSNPKTNFKLKKLQGIANNAVNVDECFNPFYMGLVRAPFLIIVDLLKKKIVPDMKGDSVEKHYKIVMKWFHEVLEKEGIPTELIDSAKVIIKPGKRAKCVIKARGREYISR